MSEIKEMLGDVVVKVFVFGSEDSGESAIVGEAIVGTATVGSDE